MALGMAKNLKLYGLIPKSKPIVKGVCYRPEKHEKRLHFFSVLEHFYLQNDYFYGYETTILRVPFFTNREVADSRTAGIFIRDTTCFHCDSMNYDSYRNLSNVLPKTPKGKHFKALDHFCPHVQFQTNYKQTNESHCWQWYSKSDLIFVSERVC